jgi:hypothetical protein
MLFYSNVAEEEIAKQFPICVNKCRFGGSKMTQQHIGNMKTTLTSMTEKRTYLRKKCRFGGSKKTHTYRKSEIDVFFEKLRSESPQMRAKKSGRTFHRLHLLRLWTPMILLFYLTQSRLAHLLSAFSRKKSGKKFGKKIWKKI